MIEVIGTRFDSFILHTGTMDHPQHAGTPEPAKAARSVRDTLLA